MIRPFDENIPLTQCEKRQLRRTAWGMTLGDSLGRLLYVAWVMSYILLSYLCFTLLSGIIQIWLIFILLLLLWYLAYLFVRFVILVRLERQLAASCFGIEVCLKCGYWLNRLPSSITQCPECAFPRVWSKKTSDSHQIK